jgi:serine/threonine protein kinase
MELSAKQGHLPAQTTLQHGKYTIKGVLGQGGFGITYLAIHKTFGEVAIKELFLNSGTIHCSRENTLRLNVVAHFDDGEFEKFKHRFSEEAKTLFSLNRIPRIAQVIDIFEENDTVYFSMHYIKGMKLDEYVKKQGGRLQESEAIRILNALGETLTEVHRYKVLHRDIKPGNIIIGTDGQPYLIDFGISRINTDEMMVTHTTIHTRYYAPPEQSAAKAKMGTYSDIYSLGATAYFMVTGNTPPELQDRFINGFDSAKSIVNTLSVPMDEAITSALQIKTEDRPQTVAAFLTLLNKNSQASIIGQAAPNKDIGNGIFGEKTPDRNMQQETRIQPNAHPDFLNEGGNKQGEDTVLIESKSIGNAVNSDTKILERKAEKGAQERLSIKERLIKPSMMRAFGIIAGLFFLFELGWLVFGYFSLGSKKEAIIDPAILPGTDTTISPVIEVVSASDHAAFESEAKLLQEKGIDTIRNLQTDIATRLKPREKLKDKFNLGQQKENEVQYSAEPEPVAASEVSQPSQPLASDPPTKEKDPDLMIYEERMAYYKSNIKGKYREPKSKTILQLNLDNTCSLDRSEGKWILLETSNKENLYVIAEFDSQTIRFSVKRPDDSEGVSLTRSDLKLNFQKQQ